MENKKVSIIVAIYKSERFLDKLITSIIEQTYTNLEIILVDDGSPDSSGQICDKYATKDNRIIVIHQKNSGTCAARNAGLAVATGNYIMIVDGDDWLELDCVSYLMKLVEYNDADMAYSDHLFTTRDRVQVTEDCIDEVTPEFAAESILYPYMKLGPWNKIYKRELLLDNNITFSVPWFGEGLYFATTAAQHASRVTRGHRKVYNYRLNNDQSGLTVYVVQHGINAVSNINTIEKNLFIDTPAMHYAINWHKWHTYFFLLRQIIGAREVEKYKKLYRDTIHAIRKLSLGVFVNSEVDGRNKLKIIAIGFFPVWMARLSNIKSARGLTHDNMK